jgi:hypothetical protein
MRARRQNMGAKGLIGKIFQDKELAWVQRPKSPLDAVKTLRTVPLCAFCIPGQGCSSQEREIFLWTAVGKIRPLRGSVGSGLL